MAALVEEAAAGDTGGDRLGDVVGVALELPDHAQQGGRVRGGLEEAGDDVGDVDAGQRRLLVLGQEGLLGPAHPGAVQSAPLHVHRLHRAGGDDEVGGLVLGVAGPAPRLDVRVGRGCLGVDDA